jgi:porphobilinogen synthase
MSVAANPVRWHRLRLRQSAHLRDLGAETVFTTAHLIQPLFVVADIDAPQEIAGLDGNHRLPLSGALDRIGADVDQGVRHFLLFAVPSRAGRSAFGTFTGRVVEAIKQRFGGRLCLWVDVCLCSSTDDGHCAIHTKHGRIDLAATLDALGEIALRAADAGADGISPSDMMDGRTAFLRAVLDRRGHGAVPIMSYSTKFASNFYGPFRDAAGSAPKHGSRAHYQIDVRSRTDALQSSLRCGEEGADLLMVKPGLTSLDLIAPIREATALPVGAYQVSGEYASLCALSRDGLLNFDAALLETWHVFRRAGASYIITYGARRALALGVPA